MTLPRREGEALIFEFMKMSVIPTRSETERFYQKKSQFQL